MLSIAERHKYILSMLRKNGFVRVTELAKELDVTPVTIRKDLKNLESKKLLYRTHGSASPVNPYTSDIDIQEKEKLKTDEKRKIALAACKLLEDNDTIILAAGSTVHAFAQELKTTSALTVVSSSLKTSMTLNSKENIEVIQFGGVIRKSSSSAVGDFAQKMLNDITCSKLFIGVDGVDVEYGVTNSNIEEANLNKKMMEAAHRIVVLTDSTKFGRRGFGRICNLDQIDVIITDAGISDKIAAEIEELGIELIIV